jgi:hypothetical protein
MYTSCGGVALLLLSVGTIVDRGGAAYNICEKTVGYARHFDKLKTIDNNASDGQSRLQHRHRLDMGWFGKSLS